MLTPLALCLHLFSIPVGNGGHMIQNCKQVGTIASFTIGPDSAHLFSGAIATGTSDKWVELLAKSEAKKASVLPDAPAPKVVASALAHAIVFLPSDGFASVEAWVARLEGGCSARADLPNALAQLAREKANPSGVVDLHLLHSLGMQIQSDKDVIASYQPWAHQAFPDEACR
jgi:hypothetical protein